MTYIRNGRINAGSSIHTHIQSLGPASDLIELQRLSGVPGSCITGPPAQFVTMYSQ